jgi:hypothetical protein
MEISRTPPGVLIAGDEKIVDANTRRLRVSRYAQKSLLMKSQRAGERTEEQSEGLIVF